jgi:hypothetical protein
MRRPDGGVRLRTLAVLFALTLLAGPALARSRARKGPRIGGDCPRSAVGTTSTDSKGASLQCKADRVGKPRWARK